MVDDWSLKLFLLILRIGQDCLAAFSFPLYFLLKFPVASLIFSSFLFYDLVLLFILLDSALHVLYHVVVDFIFIWF